jgi:hypothetical protein
MANRGILFKYGLQSTFLQITFDGSLKKWMGYIDQYVKPLEVKLKLRRLLKLLYSYLQILGPWFH